MDFVVLLCVCKGLNFLPVKFRTGIEFKIDLLTHKCLHGYAPIYSAVHNSGATLQNCPFCKFQVEFMICALIVYGQVIYFCKGFATRILLKKNFFLK